MTNFLENEEIQRSGCTALANLSNGSLDHKISVGEAGGILAVIRAVEAHSEVESVLRAAYRSLRKLGYHPGMGRDVSVGSGDNGQREADEGVEDDDDDDECSEEEGDSDDDDESMDET